MNDLQLALPGFVPESTVEWTWSDESSEVRHMSDFVHATVMRREVVDALLTAAEGSVFVDVTLGGGGHTEALLEARGDVRVVAFDRDPAAMAAAKERLAAYGDRITFVRAPFSDLVEELRARGVPRVAGVCADLGVSSPQLDDASRGMSFRREGPIDMRMDPASGETAQELIARLDDNELADVIYQFGEERRSRRIARSLKRAYADGELSTTLDLRRAIVRAVGPSRVGGVDPATRTFQALRIAVNRELDELTALLEGLPQVLAPGGVAAILSFHSLEDRLVKRAFAGEGWDPLWKKPRVPTDDECALNPRARSAKLRAARVAGEGET